MRYRDIQLDENGRLRHFLSIEGLKRQMLMDILDYAENFITVGGRSIKKVPLLRGHTVTNLFFEPSTRTRTTFELAAKRLSADVLNININTSATTKGESLLDMLRNLEAMHCDMFVVRHAQSGAAHFIARHVAPHIRVINAGDRHKGEFADLRVAIVGDILHSRVARSQIHALTTLGVHEVRVIGPETLLPQRVEELGVHVYHHLPAGLEGVDVIIMLRLQRERMQGALIPSEREYFELYGLTEEKLASGRRPPLGDIGAGQQRHRHPHGHHVHDHGQPFRQRRRGAMKLRIHGGRLIDPASGLDEIGTLCVADGRIVAVGESPEPFTADREIDAGGLVVCPGLVDLQARLREPGQEHKGTIESETAAAAAGGITTLCCPPDTDPVTDTPAVANLIQELARRAGNTRVLPIGAMTPAQPVWLRGLQQRRAGHRQYGGTAAGHGVRRHP